MVGRLDGGGGLEGEGVRGSGGLAGREVGGSAG